MQALGRSFAEIAPSYEVVVIGSGYGGAVVAARLAQVGRSVCVFERGREVLPGAFPTDATSFVGAAQLEHRGGHVGDRSALFRFVMDDDCGAAMGCGLGGTSLINGGVALRPDDASWDELRWPAALRADRDLLDACFERAEAMLRPTPYPSDGPRLPKLDALEAAARSLGQADAFSRPPLTIAFKDGASAAGVEQPACALCGDCLTGCNTGAKTTLLTTYLPEAVQHGAQLFPEVEVRFIERTPHGYRVHYDPLALERGRFGAPPLFVDAETVVLAAGALGSTEILLRSRAAGLCVSRELGRRFSGNGTTLAFGYDNARPVNAVGARRGATVGPAIAGMIDLREGTRMLVQESSVPRPLATGISGLLRMTPSGGSAWSRIGGALRALTGESIERTQCYAVTARDDSGGRLELEDDRLRIRWPGAGLQPVVSAIHDRIASATEALGGRFVPNPAWANLPARPPITTHPLGGCAMAEDGAHGVVDDRGRVFDGETASVHDGLYVCDGSILPGALGCNPLLTISALAERCATLLVRERGWAAIESPSDRPSQATRSVQPFGLRFTERMIGYVRATASEAPPAPPRERGLNATSFSFICTLAWPDLDTLLADPSALARSFGTVEAPLLSPHALRVIDGRFRLLVRGEDGTLRMIHRLVIESRTGARYFVDGYKTIDAEMGRGVWPDTTTLFFHLYEGSDHTGAQLGHGAVEVRIRDLVSQVSTMRGAPSGFVAKRGASLRFVASFTARMSRVYAGLTSDDP